MDRSYQEILDAARAVRHKLIKEGRDPLTGQFFISAREKLTVLDHPPFMTLELSPERDHIYGLKLKIIADGPPDSGGGSQ